MQKTCCQRAEIVLTDGDVRRIAAHVGHRDFFERRRPADPAYLEPDEDDPQWLEWTAAADGTRRMLVRDEDGDCTFLGPQGCRLDEETRPLVCRLYPWAYTEAGIDGVDDEYCPASLVPAGGSMPGVLGMRLADGRRWHRQLYDELRAGSARLEVPR
jgi:Fe-S-cluster containining protein